MPGMVVASAPEVGTGRPPDVLSGVTEISAGGYDFVWARAPSLALVDGQVVTWDGYGGGKLEGVSQATAIAAGGSFFGLRPGTAWATEAGAALVAGGVVVIGGGVGDVPADLTSGIRAIDSEKIRFVAMKGDAAVTFEFQESLDSLFTRLVPRPVPPEARAGVVAVAQGSTTGYLNAGAASMALKGDGRVIAWDSETGNLLPVPAGAQSGIVAIAGGQASMALNRFGGVIAWDPRTGESLPVPTQAQSGVTRIAAGGTALGAVKGGQGGFWSLTDPTWSVPLGFESGITAISVYDRNALGIRVLVSPPAQPMRVTANPLPGGKALISWAGPAGGTEPVAQYKVTASPGGVTCTARPESPSCEISGLGTGIPYTFTVIASNYVGDSLASKPSAPLTLVGPPDAPRSVTVAAGNGAVFVEWQAPLNSGGEPIAGYTAMAWPGGETCTTSGELFCTVSGLENGSAYTFQVVAQTSAGTSLPSSESGSVVPSALLPTVARAVAATAADRQATVTWSPPADSGGSPVTGYEVWSSPGKKSCATATSFSCTVEGLTNGTSYTFTVTASNVAGTSLPSRPSAPVIPLAQIVKPGAVTRLNAVAGRGLIRVTWSRPSSGGGAPSVSYQYKAGSQAWRATSSTSVSIPGKKGVSLRVKVRAVNSAGPGPVRSVKAAPN